MIGRDFTGKTVVVTGAAGGLGRALCRRFAAAGARIVALDRDDAGLAVLLDELPERTRHASFRCDVTDSQACTAAIAGVVARDGRIDVLIANAGISHRSRFADTSLEVLYRVMDVNFWGAVHVTKAALPRLIAARGLIVTISSVAGIAPLIGRTGYAASKHALHGLFDSLRSELIGDGVEVLLVCPAFIATGIERAALGADGDPARGARQITGRQATPQQVADAIFEAATSGRRLLLFGGTAKASYWLSRLWPRAYAASMRRKLKSEFE